MIQYTQISQSLISDLVHSNIVLFVLLVCYMNNLDAVYYNRPVEKREKDCVGGKEMKYDTWMEPIGGIWIEAYPS